MGDFGLEVGKTGDKAGVEGGVGGEDSPCAITVVVSEVVGNISVDGVHLHQLRGQRSRVSVRANERNVASAAEARGGEAACVGTADVGERDSLGLELKHLYGLVDSILGHLTVCSPLATGAGEETGWRGGDEVASDEGFGVLRVGVLDERSDACEC